MSIFFVYKSDGLVNPASLFCINPDIFIWLPCLITGNRPIKYRCYSDNFAYNEVQHAKAKARQSVYFQTSIDAKARHRARYIARYRRRIF